MMHNTLYRLQKNQYLALVSLSILFIVSSLVWFFAELFNTKFPFEPIVVLIGGLTTLFAVFWPFKPTYADRRLSSKVIFDYMKNSGYFPIGREDLSFNLKFSDYNNEAIYINIKANPSYQLALAKGVCRISEIRDISAFDYSSDNIVVDEDSIACIRNEFGNYACIKVHDVKSISSKLDNIDEVTFSYVINPDNGTDFS